VISSLLLILIVDVWTIEIGSKGVEEQELHALVQYFKTDDAARQREIDVCLMANLNNKQLDGIHLLLERESDFPAEIIPKQRIQTLEDLSRQPTRKAPSLPKVSIGFYLFYSYFLSFPFLSSPLLLLSQLNSSPLLGVLFSDWTSTEVQ
jgi:hypothetical protein